MILYVNLHTHLIIILFHVVSRLLPFGGVEIQSPLRIDNSIKNDWQIFFYCLVGEKRCVEFSISRCRTFCGANRSKSLHISLFSLVWLCLGCSGQLSHTFTNSFLESNTAMRISFSGGFIFYYFELQIDS